MVSDLQFGGKSVSTRLGTLVASGALLGLPGCGMKPDELPPLPAATQQQLEDCRIHGNKITADAQASIDANKRTFGQKAGDLVTGNNPPETPELTTYADKQGRDARLRCEDYARKRNYNEMRGLPANNGPSVAASAPDASASAPEVAIVPAPAPAASVPAESAQAPVAVASAASAPEVGASAAKAASAPESGASAAAVAAPQGEWGTRVLKRIWNGKEVEGPAAGGSAASR